MLSPTAQPRVHLTPRQMQLLRFIVSTRQSKCCSPTMAELANRLDLSRSTVFEHIAELRRKGLLSASRGRARSLTATSEALELLESIDRPADPEPFGGESIPLAGVVAAGTPIEALEQTERLSLASYFGLSDDMFALEVRGNSMIDDDIHEGDYVICKKASTAVDGQLVIAVVDDNEATLKRFYREGSRARLQPANDACEAIYSDHCRIEAIVVGLIRKL